MSTANKDHIVAADNFKKKNINSFVGIVRFYFIALQSKPAIFLASADQLFRDNLFAYNAGNLYHHYTPIDLQDFQVSTTNNQLTFFLNTFKHT
jgi:hypothetical protein